MIQDAEHAKTAIRAGSGERGRLLIVDDNREHLQTLEMLFDMTAHECQFFDTGTAAIEAARHVEFDLLLTDVRMAPLDGVETARAIKSLQPLVAVVMMTGFDKEDTPLEALRLGAVDYIDKPIIDIDRLLTLVTQQVRLVHSAKQLRATSDRLAAVVDHVDAGVLVLDSHGRVEQANAAARSLVMPEVHEPIGALFRDVCGLTELHFLSPKQGTVSTMCHVNTASGARLLQVDATRLQGTPGQPAGMVLLIKDLTTLAEGQKAEGWRQMSRAITHGMKTPLGTLRMRLERLRAAPPTGEPLIAEVDNLLGVVGELHGRLSDLVDFVKLDMSQARHDLNVVAERALARFAPHRRATTEIRFTPHPQPVPLNLAAAALGLAVENLLANAQEAAPGGVNIEVSIDVPPNGETCSIIVADDGPGMPSELAGDVFQRPLNSTKPGGTGLGTALVKYIVDQHRGCLTWDSPSMNDHGTRVTLSLPR